MTFDEWWATTKMVQNGGTSILLESLKKIAELAWNARAEHGTPSDPLEARIAEVSIGLFHNLSITRTLA
jgi:hypothetical protein